MTLVPAAPCLRSCLMALLAACLVGTGAAACSPGPVDEGANGSGTTAPATGSVTVPPPTPSPTPPPSITSATASGSGQAGSEQWCEALSAGDGGRVANPALTEVSGLAASEVHPGVIWAHNDSGNETALFAIGPDGADLGRFPLIGVRGVDIEDMALVDGVVHLADIGDNDEGRSEVAVYRFAEPDPSTPGPIDGVETLRFRHRDGPVDAEAFLVDPVGGELVVIAKEFQFAPDENSDSFLAAAPATVLVARPPLPPDEVGVLEPVGTVALDRLDLRAEGRPADGLPLQLGLGGLATGADISVDGGVIALRTYETVWLFDRPPGTTVAAALTGEPCEAPSRPESQGEAVAIVPPSGPGGRLSLVTIGEGSNPEITVIAAGS